MLHTLRTDLSEAPTISNSDALLRYLHVSMAHITEEEFRVLFFDATNRLLAEEVISKGSSHEVQAHPRPIVKRSFELGATALILVHNHPCGDPRPSKDDVSTTRRIATVAKELEIHIHDHIVISRSGWQSFRALGLL